MNETIPSKVNSFIRSLSEDRELAAYMAGVLRGIYITGMSPPDAMTFLYNAWHAGDAIDMEKMPQADIALRQVLSLDVLATFRLFDQMRVN